MCSSTSLIADPDHRSRPDLLGAPLPGRLQLSNDSELRDVCWIARVGERSLVQASLSGIAARTTGTPSRVTSDRRRTFARGTILERDPATNAESQTSPHCCPTPRTGYIKPPENQANPASPRSVFLQRYKRRSESPLLIAQTFDVPAVCKHLVKIEAHSMTTIWVYFIPKTVTCPVCAALDAGKAL